MARKKTLAETKPRVDVSGDEMHYTVQCADVRLISSALKPAIAEKGPGKSPHFAFRVRALVQGTKAYSYLEVHVNHRIPAAPAKVTSFELSFVLMGTFIAKQNMPSSDLANFVKMYTVTVLWPYAREYATDQFRRAGSGDIILPIINPQIVTEHIVENNLVEVQILREGPGKKKLRD